MALRGRKPIRTMLLLSALTGAVVNPGNMLTADGQRRLQATHSLWRGEPPVLPSDQHVFGNVGRDGRIYAWYGLGHSLYMLPFDAASHAILGALPVEESLRRKADSALVAWMSQSVLLLLALFSARGLLLRLGFHDRSASLGTAALLFATTVLHYVQNAQENLLLLACGLLAFHAATRWSDTGLRRDAFAAGAAAGFAILTRLTAALDVACLLIFAALLLRGRLARFARQAAPAFLLFALIERLYNFHRFGNWLGSYMPNMRDPLRGPAPVFARPFSEGFFGALFAPDVSVFLFDPLLAPAFVLIAIAWSKLSREVRVYAACGVLLLFAHITFHARYDTYSGEVAWGHRYAAGGVQLIALLAVPLAVAHWRSFNTAARSAIALCAIAAGITQLSSVMVVMGVEELQMERDGHAVFVLARRWENIGLVWSNRAEGHPLFRGVPREWTRPAPLPFQLEFRHAQLKRIAVPAWWALVVLTLAFAVRLAFSSTPSPGPPPHHAHLSPRRATRPSAPA